MTSKEALDILNYECIHCNGTDDEFSKELNLIKKDLEVLEILKKYVFFDKEDNYIKMFDIKECITNFDFEIVKEWLENDLRRKLQN